MATTQNSATIKRSMCQELETTVKLAVAANSADRPLSGDLTQALCTVVEAIFIHGLRDAFFLKGSRYSKRPAPNFWPFISKYTHRSIKTQIATFNQIRSEIGKARAWIRVVLNETALDQYISLFEQDTRQLNQFYDADAFLRDADSVHALTAQLKKLGSVQIAAPTNSSLLNAWTPSPLALAGLIEGTSRVKAINSAAAFDAASTNGMLSPFKIGSPGTITSSVLEDAETELLGVVEGGGMPELGMNADLLLDANFGAGAAAEDQPAQQQIDDPFSKSAVQQQQATCSSALGDDLLLGDTTSLYSHPSMLEESSSITVFSPCGNSQSQYFAAAPNLAFPAAAFLPPPLTHSAASSSAASIRRTSSTKWMTLMPAEQLSSEVVVHRKSAKPRHRRRTVSRSSGGSDNSAGGDSSSRCQSSTNLQTFAESAENKEEIPPIDTNREETSKMEAKQATNGGKKEEKVAEEWQQKEDNESEGKEEVVVGEPPRKEEEEEHRQAQPIYEVESPRLAALRRNILSAEELDDGMGSMMNVHSRDQQQQISSPASLPPLGTSLQDELFLAGEVGRMDDDDERRREEAPQADSEELARKKYSAIEAPQDLPKIGSSPAGGKVNFSYSTDSMDDPSQFGGQNGEMPATFDEALRDFLGQEAEKRRAFGSSKRLFSECSSAASTEHNANGSADLAQQFSISNSQSPAAHSTRSAPIAVAAPGAGPRRGSSTPHTFLFRTKELPPSPFKLEEQRTPDEEEELVEILEFSSSVSSSELPPPQWARNDSAPYRIPRRLFRLTQLARERGLDSQGFRCAACRRNIGVSFGPYKACALNGRYYCTGTAHCIRAGGADCESLIPARVILNGDFRTRTVSKESRQLLKAVQDKPFLRLDALNPHIYTHCTSLRKIKELRLKFSLLVLYLISCKDSIAEDIRRRVWPHQHWHEDIHLYSIADFESVANGTMERRLIQLIQFAQSHVQSCRICLQKGFFCELCNASDRPIYPFQTEITHRCPTCASVFHKECARKADLLDKLSNCPKCLRRAKYSSPALSVMASSGANASGNNNSPQSGASSRTPSRAANNE